MNMLTVEYRLNFYKYPKRLRKIINRFKNPENKKLWI